MINWGEILEDLTPGGPEFHNDPARCIYWIRDQLSIASKLAAALQFYAAEDNWYPPERFDRFEWEPYPEPSPVMEDAGKNAQEALADYEAARIT